MEETVMYDQLLPMEFEQRISQFPLVYVPIGSLEWHGQHLPLGNDTIKIQAVCEEAARISGGVVFPGVYFGIPGMVEYGSAYKFNGNAPFDPGLVGKLLNAILNRLEAVGFLAAVVITGHTPPEQRKLVKDVAAEYSGKMLVLGTADSELGGGIGHASDHAAMWETSLLWYIRPDLVDINRLPRDLSTGLESVFGNDPRTNASRDLGRKAFRVITEELAQTASNLIKEKKNTV